MKKHLIFYGTAPEILKLDKHFLTATGWMYWSKRLQVWKWRLKQTMGRPILVMRKSQRFK